MSSQMEKEAVLVELAGLQTALDSIFRYCRDSAYWLIPCECGILHNAKIGRCVLCGVPRKTTEEVAKLFIKSIEDALASSNIAAIVNTMTAAEE